MENGERDAEREEQGRDGREREEETKREKESDLASLIRREHLAQLLIEQHVRRVECHVEEGTGLARLAQDLWYYGREHQRNCIPWFSLSLSLSFSLSLSLSRCLAPPCSSSLCLRFSALPHCPPPIYSIDLLSLSRQSLCCSFSSPNSLPDSPSPSASRTGSSHSGQRCDPDAAAVVEAGVIEVVIARRQAHQLQQPSRLQVKE